MELATTTIEGYRSAISNTIKAVKEDVDLGKDISLTSLISNFNRDKNKKKTRIPPWNLSLVLRKLNQAPFEPIKDATLKFLTYKTVFLLALATGKRRSELHAMKHDVYYTEGWSSVTIVPDPNFVAKTQLPGKGSSLVNVVEVKALTNFVSKDMEEDLMLCPVRALKRYLKHTKSIRGESTQLFISLKGNTKRDIHPSTISNWIKKTIILTHQEANDKDFRLTGVKAHQTRGVAASMALLHNAALDDILNACSWKHHTTFSSYYLKDIALQSGDMYHMGPVICAGQVCQDRI